MKVNYALWVEMQSLQTDGFKSTQTHTQSKQAPAASSKVWTKSFRGFIHCSFPRQKRFNQRSQEVEQRVPILFNAVKNNRMKRQHKGEAYRILIIFFRCLQSSYGLKWRKLCCYLQENSRHINYHQGQARGDEEEAITPAGSQQDICTKIGKESDIALETDFRKERRGERRREERREERRREEEREERKKKGQQCRAQERR